MNSVFLWTVSASTVALGARFARPLFFTLGTSVNVDFSFDAWYNVGICLKDVFFDRILPDLTNQTAI